MSRNHFRALVAGGLLLILVGVNFAVWQREALITDGRSVLLELAPVDPRSLMQGDYMALRFAVAQKLRPDGRATPETSDGYVVVKRDARNIGVFDRIYRKDEALAANEARIRYRLRNHDVRIVTNAWFFKEGTAAEYSGARYGELRVGDNGDALLVGMRDKDLKLLGNAEK